MSVKTIPAEQNTIRRLKKMSSRLYAIMIGLTFTMLATLILLFPILPHNEYDLAVGDIVEEDIRAPRQITYTSAIETQRAREAALAKVPDIYDPPDARIGRHQVRQAALIMEFIKDVRADAYASFDRQMFYLNAIKDLPIFSEESASILLNITDTQFETIKAEVVTLVEEAMSGTVQEGRVGEITSQLELKVSSDIQEELIPLTVSLARDLVVPNSFLNEEKTKQLQDDTLANVPEIKQSFQPGEVIVRAGEPVTVLDLEALAQLGLASEKLTWFDVGSAALISLVGVVIVAIYLGVFNTTFIDRPGRLFLLMTLALIFLLAAQFMVVGQTSTAYLFPLAALSLSLAALLRVDVAAMVSLVVALMAGYMSGNSLELSTYMGVMALLATGTLRRGERLNSFFRAGVFAVLGGMAVILIFRLPGETLNNIKLGELLLMALLNGLLSAGMALVILYVVGGLTGITTSLQLIDLMRPDHPLQKRLQKEALGTYQHTLSVANLAEAAAEAIGANSLLTRVGTLYHDIGKMSNPGFFVENRTSEAGNPHDKLNPYASARIIKAHVSDGIDMARRRRLPPEITAFIPEHHGTMPILYFLARAREQAEKTGDEVDEAAFCYDGPRPQSRETAIMMLADSCESAVRANQSTTVEELESVISAIIEKRVALGQLDESGLTLTDIKIIRETFVRTLQGMYHPRVRYPGDEKKEAEKPEEAVSGGDDDQQAADSDAPMLGTSQKEESEKETKED